MVSIEIRHLTKRFVDVVALNDINLRIESGELFFLLGPSGCGKTTLLRHIAGFYKPDHGQVLFGSTDVTNKPAHLRNTAMMFQSYALWPHMTVAKNVAFGLEERKLPGAEIEERVVNALAMVRMADYADRKINQLSGGQQQRVALARALVVRPQCLLLDEPLSNLDAKLRLEMRSEIRRICKDFGLTGVYVTHDQKEALSMADRMAILEAGRIMQVGTPQDVYCHPKTRSVADFIGETNFVPGTFVSTDSKNRYLVNTEIGDFIGRLPEDAAVPPKGKSVYLSIRPETLRLADSHEYAQSNFIEGTLGETIYLGEVAHYHLHTTGNPPKLQISELNPAHVKAAAIEAQAFAHVDPEDVVILQM
ncbi:MAG: ABC transporter ATP-binding protein [Verrucomicrobiota bacterium]